MKNVIQMLLVLTIIGIVSGGLLSEVSNWAKPKIAHHRKVETEKAIFKVQPEAKSYEDMSAGGYELYKVFNEKKDFIGYALPYEGNGFQGKIRLMVGIDNKLESMKGLEVLEQVETPGLGTKVTESDFTKQFIELKAVPKIEWVKGAEPDQPNEIQAITGATISSKSVVEIINAGIDKLRKTQGEMK